MKLMLSVIVSLAISASAHAGEALAITPEEVWHKIQHQDEAMLFVDVRDPVEIMFTGFTNAVDTNIPFKLVDRKRFNNDRGKFAMVTNPDFANAVEEALRTKGLDKNALIVTMCRSGSSRGKPSADYLLERGFTNVKFVDHGFQGSAVKNGKRKGQRVVNGWQNAGLPWSMTINPEKIYRP